MELRIWNDDFVGMGEPLLIWYDERFTQEVGAAVVEAAKARGLRVRHLAISVQAARELLGSIPPEEKRYTIGIDENALDAVAMLVSPGNRLVIEVTFLLPPGVVSIY